MMVAGRLHWWEGFGGDGASTTSLKTHISLSLLPCHCVHTLLPYQCALYCLSRSRRVHRATDAGLDPSEMRSLYWL